MTIAFNQKLIVPWFVRKIDDQQRMLQAAGEMKTIGSVEEIDFVECIADFEIEVNNDLEDDMVSIPESTEDMIEAIMLVCKNHVSEIDSPPRVTSLANEYKLKAGFAVDLTVCDEDGNHWDFDNPRDARKSENYRP